MAEAELLADFLAHVRPRCPDCGYRLEGAASDRCPECGHALVLQLQTEHEARRGLGSWAVGTLAGLSVIPLCLAMMLVGDAEQVGGRIGLGFVAGGGGLVAAFGREAFLDLSPPARIGVAAGLVAVAALFTLSVARLIAS